MSKREDEQKQKEFLKILDREDKRTIREKYSYHKIKWGWYIVPLLFIVAGGIFWYLTRNEGVNSTFEWLYIINIVAFFVSSSYDEKWGRRLKVKYKISEEDNGYKFADGYSEEIVCTDSEIERILYLLSKIVIYLEGTIGVCVMSLLAFSWLGSITIAPTTIIIILLVVIIYNQEKRSKS